MYFYENFDQASELYSSFFASYSQTWIRKDLTDMNAKLIALSTNYGSFRVPNFEDDSFPDQLSELNLFADGVWAPITLDSTTLN